MKEFIFATHNAHKAKEVQAAMPEDILVLTLKDIDFHEEIPETGLTLEENALIKARTIYKTLHKNCFADDTGLEVESLDGAPGVYSARYAGEENDATKNIEKLLENLKHKTNRKARFRTVFSLITEGKEYLFEGIVRGEILLEKHGESGFGYDPVFLPDGFKISFAEMTLEEKNNISHRGIALRKMADFIKDKNLTGFENL